MRAVKEIAVQVDLRVPDPATMDTRPAAHDKG
jgi:hypothetical protein